MITLWVRSPEGDLTRSRWDAEHLMIGQSPFTGALVPFIADAPSTIQTIAALVVAELIVLGSGEYLIRSVDHRTAKQGRAAISAHGRLLDPKARFMVRDGDIVRIDEWTLRIGLLHTRRAPSPPTQIEEGFLDALAKRPDDDELREVYADWLEIHNRFAAASMLRLQLRIEHAAEDDPALPTLIGELRRAACEVADEAWRARAARPLIEKCNGTAAAAADADDDVRLEVECPKRWENLAKTDRDNVRHCDACRKEVTFCKTMDEARGIAWQGGCLVLDASLLRKPKDLEPPPLKSYRMGMATLHPNVKI